MWFDTDWSVARCQGVDNWQHRHAAMRIKNWFSNVCSLKQFHCDLIPLWDNWIQVKFCCCSFLLSVLFAAWLICAHLINSEHWTVQVIGNRSDLARDLCFVLFVFGILCVVKNGYEMDTRTTVSITLITISLYQSAFAANQTNKWHLLFVWLFIFKPNETATELNMNFDSLNLWHSFQMKWTPPPPPPTITRAAATAVAVAVAVTVPKIHRPNTMYSSEKCECPYSHRSLAINNWRYFSERLCSNNCHLERWTKSVGWSMLFSFVSITCDFRRAHFNIELKIPQLPILWHDEAVTFAANRKTTKIQCELASSTWY